MKELKDGSTRKSGCYTCKYSKPETLHDRQETRCLLDNMLVMRPSKGCAELKVVTNGDRIRQMTDEELVMALDTDCNRCAKSENCELCGDPVSYGDCVEGNIEWLKQEVNSDDESGNDTDNNS